MSAEIVLTDLNGLQIDGTALYTDTLQVSYGADLGTPSTVIWWCNGAAKGVYTTEGGELTKAFTSDDIKANVYAGAGLAAGDWWVTIENTEGLTSVTNVITVTDVAIAVMSDVSFEDDYETDYAAAIDFEDETNEVIVGVTFNKNYEGTIYIAPADEKTFTTAKLTNKKVLNAGGLEATFENVKKAANFTNKAATDSATGDGIYYKDADGAVHVKFVVPAKVTRGTDYMLIFDQKDVKGDEVGTVASAKKEDLNISDEATVPYVEAPATIAITAYDKDVVGETEITFYDESGAVMAWWDDGQDTIANSVLTGTVYQVDSNKIDSGDTPRTIQTLTVDEGKATATFVGVADKTYAYAKIKTVAGIFGEDSIELTSEVVESAPKAASKVELKEASTAADATVTFTGLHKKANGTVYILQGDTGLTEAAAIVAQGKDEAIASAAVEGGSISVSVANVFKSKFVDYDGTQTDNANKFVALFIPDDTSVYSSVYSDVFKLESVPTSLEFISALATAPADSAPGAVTGSISLASDDTEIAVKDQFGKTITQNGKSVSAKAVSDLKAKHAGGNYSEGFGNATYNISSNGALTVAIARTTAIDRGDGLEFSILGSKFTLTAPFGVGGHNQTNCWTAKLGDNTLYEAAMPAAGLEVKDQNSLIDALGGAGEGDTVILGVTTALTKAITVKANTTLQIKAGVTLTLGADKNKIYGTLDAAETGAVLAAANKTVVAYDGATIIGSKVATNMTNMTKLSIDAEATEDGVTITNSDGDNAGSLVLFATTGASDDDGTATVVTDGSANVKATSTASATITLVGNGDDLEYTPTDPA